MVPGGGLTTVELPILAKNRALPFFFTITTASFGLNTNRCEKLFEFARKQTDIQA